MSTNLYSWQFILAPFITWMVCGCVKFIVMGVRARHFTIKNNGYGGFPSNHTAVVSSISFMLIFNRVELASLFGPLLGVSLAFGFLFVQDALSLRRKIGLMVQKVNELTGSSIVSRTGHTPLEVIGGIVVAGVVTWLIHIVYESLAWM
jgi:acid phosphatase family membrane protein YuiD